MFCKYSQHKHFLTMFIKMCSWQRYYKKKYFLNSTKLVVHKHYSYERVAKYMNKIIQFNTAPCSKITQNNYKNVLRFKDNLNGRRREDVGVTFATPAASEDG